MCDGMDTIEMSDLSIFANPEFLEKAQRIIKAFEMPDANGWDLYNQLKSLIEQQSEWDFEQEVKDHPYGVEVKGLGKEDFAANHEENTLAWLKANVAKADYIFMPRNATGKYKDKWNWCYFRNHQDAVLFKLTLG